MYFSICNPADYHAALYIRLSREETETGPAQSIENQISLLTEFSEKHRLLVYRPYVDDGFSGTAFDRPAFLQMIRDIENRKINMVITKDLSRLGRDYIMTGYYMEQYFPEHRVRYLSLLDGIDTGIESAVNDITPFQAVINDMYAKDISRKILSVKRSKQKMGLFIGGKPPYGYKAHPDGKYKFVIDENTAPIVRRIFSMARSGMSCRRIACTLNAEQIPSPAVYAGIRTGRSGPYAGLWSSERISDMLRNEVYIGNMVQGRFASVGYKSRKSVKLPRSQWTVVPHTHPPIIDTETFNAVERQIRSRTHAGRRCQDYLLKGLIFCHDCGYPLGVINSVGAGGGKQPAFVCRTYQRFSRAGICTSHYCSVNAVTEAVMAKVMEICREYLQEDLLTSRAREILEKSPCIPPFTEKIRCLEKKLRSLSVNLDRTYSARLAGTLTSEEFQKQYAEIKAQEAAFRRKLQGLQVPQEGFSALDPDFRKLSEKFIHIVRCSPALLKALVGRIELSEDRALYIKFRFQDPDVH